MEGLDSGERGAHSDRQPGIDIDDVFEEEGSRATEVEDATRRQIGTRSSARSSVAQICCTSI